VNRSNGFGSRRGFVAGRASRALRCAALYGALLPSAVVFAVLGCAGSKGPPALARTTAPPVAAPALTVPVSGARYAPLTVITLLRTRDVASAALFDAMRLQHAALGPDALRWVLITGDGKFEIDADDAVQQALHARFGGDVSFDYLERVFRQGQAGRPGHADYGARLQAGLAVQRALGLSQPPGAPPLGNVIGPTSEVDSEPEDDDPWLGLGEPSNSGEDRNPGADSGAEEDGEFYDEHGLYEGEEFDQEDALTRERELERWREVERKRQRQRQTRCEGTEQCELDLELGALRSHAGRARLALSINGIHVLGLPPAVELERLLRDELRAAQALRASGTPPKALFAQRVSQNQGRVLTPNATRTRNLASESPKGPGQAPDGSPKGVPQ
jgi:hypothetical protein